MTTTPIPTTSPSLQPSRKKFWRRRSVRIAITLLALYLIIYTTWESALRLIPALPPTPLPRGATFIEDRNGNELAAFVGQEDTWFIPLTTDQIPLNLKNAVVAAEDRRFYDHHGIDWRSVLGAAWQDVAALHIRRGASTITMQLIRLRDPRSRSFAAKFSQAFRAEQLELATPKEAILTEYLNRAPFGGNLTGAGAASWHYFGKSAVDLSLGQAALLAGLPQSPTRFRPDRNPAFARQRRHHVLEQMLDMHTITPQEFTTADNEPIEILARVTPDYYGAFPTLTRLAAENPGQKLRTTLDPAIQQSTYQAAMQQFHDLQSSGVDSGAVLVIDVPTASILASISLNSGNESIDLTTRPRSTGSILKPFLYAAAFHEGILTPNTQLLDSPKAWAGYTPSNFDKNFRGKMSAADALAESRNIPAMIVLSKLTLPAALSTLADFGIRTPSQSNRDYGLSLAIGGAEATPSEIAEAYTTLASGGLHQTLHLLPASATPTRILPSSTCYQTLSCLSNPARTNIIDNADVAAKIGVAWKTGTSNGLRDAWCAAATSHHVVVVWFGNRQSRGNSALVGQDAAAPLALKIIAILDKNLPPSQPWPSTILPAKDNLELASNNQLSIVTPITHTEILTESNHPPRVPLKSAGGIGNKRWWFANGLPITSTPEDQIAWWSPAAGSYDLRVIDESGNAASVKVQVR